jgi:hypothetical protein
MSPLDPREEELFDAARKLPDSVARAAFLDRACAADRALRQRLDELLAAAVDAETFLPRAAPR